MATNDEFEPDSHERSYQQPYTSRHPIPTVQKYRAERSEREDNQEQAQAAQQDEGDESTLKRAFHAAKGVIKHEDPPQSSHDPYKTENRNVIGTGQPTNGSRQDEPNDDGARQQGQRDERSQKKSQNNDKPGQSATEAVAGQTDPRQKRKAMKHRKQDGGREVTDPVTHLPIIIRDSTPKDLQNAGLNIPASGTETRTRTGMTGASKSQDELDAEKDELQRKYNGMQKLFPPPSFEDVKNELARTYRLALAVGLGSVVLLVSLAMAIVQLVDFDFSHSHSRSSKTSSSSLDSTRSTSTSTWFSIIPIGIILMTSVGIGAGVIWVVQGWLGKRVEDVWKDEVWDAARSEELEANEQDDVIPESVAWLNNLLAAIWPLINPDLFASISDMLEDVMQASLPKVVRMVSVDDLGQGSEAFRILGINWLPTGAASQTVGGNGKLKSANDQGQSDRLAPGDGQDEGADDEDSGDDSNDSNDKNQETKQKEQEQEAIREGMEAEQGDFVNMEVAFAYRARSSGKALEAKAKNAHLYLKFYLPGGIAVPVWVELRGIIGTMRLRLQLTPDPPFFSLCTLTFMGQPQADLSCVPLSKHALNLMDVPMISSFVQSSIDAALAEYVAPKSLTLDLKDMIVGDDFKKDTIARGVVIVYIESAKDFKEGDGGFGPFGGSSDAYVTVSWGKFGKPVASTRVIVDDQKPSWHEWANILVTPEELNADEKLQLQLWDSDKYTADDDLGRVEVDLKELMHSPKTKNRMCEREDRFQGEDPDEKMPGTLKWRVGYFSKSKITGEQLARQTADPDIKSHEQLKEKVNETAKNKLREATAHDESKEIQQQEREDYKEREGAMMISSPPPDDYLSGVFSIQIHNITGLEVQSLQKRDKKHGDGDREDEAEQSDDMPSSYATIILNHQKIYRTRTKPKNAKPFFNAGTERFVSNWKTAEVMIAVRDDRERENDALLGMIYLPLHRVFEKKSQVMQSYPLVGGMGYGRARISMVWRSVELKLPKELLGWNYGTLEVRCPVKAKSGASDGAFMHNRIKLRTNLMKAKMAAAGDNNEGLWKPKHDKDSVFLAVRKRYSSPLIIEFRRTVLGPDHTSQFGVFWLKDIPDEEETTVTVKVWKGSKKAMHRATTSYGYDGVEDGEHALGEIELTLSFWRGLSGYHKTFANKGANSDIRDTMEVLDTANDEHQVSDDEDEDDSDSDSNSDSTSDTTAASEKQAKRKNRKLKTHVNDDSDEADSDTEETGHGKLDPTQLAQKPFNVVKDVAAKVLDVDGHNDENNGSRGVRAQIRDYKDHRKQLHRKHRGIMQWRATRTVGWMADKVKRGKGRIGEVFEHDDDKKGGGVETEV
ncbi:hypothetical protein EDD37DRAFT_633093 [Exophiala viscosa]|uniref:uncharacterized protein n=1 Tax=Exophiala viscosa TaxID=2486360 RepID=UPI0021947B1B|nr:hypothetical protein EDD37DRAFT_633093 [Exophiala viscosa]